MYLYFFKLIGANNSKTVKYVITTVDYSKKDAHSPKVLNWAQ